jgi:acyl carrier protein
MTTLTHDIIIPALLTWLKDIVPDQTVELNDQTQLIAQNLLDSMDLLRLVSWLEDTYGVSIDPDLLVPENFETPTKVADLVLRHQA